MEMQNKMQKIAEFAKEKKIIIASDALKQLTEIKEWQKILSECAEKNIFVVTKQEIEKLQKKTQEEKTQEYDPEKSAGELKASWEKNFRVLRELEVSGKCNSKGKVDDFTTLFREKFTGLKKILEERHTLRGKPIKRLKHVREKEEIEIIGMVYRKWITKAGHTAMEIEDLEDQCIAVIPKNEKDLEPERNRIIDDDVIGIRGVKISNDMIIVKEILWPDIPQRSPKLLKKETFFASISDLHIGSKLFLENEFNKFLSWIKGDIGNHEEKKFVKKIKYLFITGDNIDGIGIYPKQREELNIKSIKEQYETFSNYILEIPQEIEIFIIPGQHDAVRWADPQPAITEKLVPKLYQAENVHLMGSPSWVEIEGIKFLLYHGACMHNIFSNISGLSYEKPYQGVIELLRRRDFMPAYGFKQPYVPESKNYMVLKDIPDFVLTGDLHHIGYANYRGTSIINNSTWQNRTDYQVRLGHIPTPGIAVAVSLKNRKIYEKRFQVN